MEFNSSLLNTYKTFEKFHALVQVKEKEDGLFCSRDFWGDDSTFRTAISKHFFHLVGQVPAARCTSLHYSLNGYEIPAKYCIGTEFEHLLTCRSYEYEFGRMYVYTWDESNYQKWMKEAKEVLTNFYEQQKEKYLQKYNECLMKLDSIE